MPPRNTNKPFKISQANSQNKQEQKEKKSKNKLIAPTQNIQNLNQPIDSICQICKKLFTMHAHVICKQCGLKYHQICLTTQNQDPKKNSEGNWICSQCMKEPSQMMVQTLKKPKQYSISDFFQKSNKSLVAKTNKFSDFQQRFPNYYQDGKVIYPILDEYLIEYKNILQVQIKEKPPLKIDDKIPTEFFKYVIQTWDSYNNIILLTKNILEERYSYCKLIINQLKIKSRIEILNIIINDPKSIILFFCFQYIREIFENIPNLETFLKQQFKIPFWYIIGFIWFTDRILCYEILIQCLNVIPYYIMIQFQQKHNQNLYNLDFNDHKQIFKTLIILINGIQNLTITSQLIDNRIDNVAEKHKAYNQLCLTIKQLEKTKKDLKKTKKAIEDKISEYQKKLLKNNDSQIIDLDEDERLQQELQIIVQRLDIITKDLNQHQQQQLQEYQKLITIQIPQLMLNPNVSLGYDMNYNSYYYFIFEPDKIFVQLKDKMWGYYESINIQELLNSLCEKGVREKQLKQNITDILNGKLFYQITQDSSDCEIQEKPTIMEEFVISIKSLIQLFKQIEINLFQYLTNIQARWCSTKQRNDFLKKLDQTTNLESLSQQIRIFVEKIFFFEQIIDNEDINQYQQNDQEEEEIPIEKKTNNEEIQKKKLKLFGYQFENLRKNLIEQLNQKDNKPVILKVCLFVLNQILNDFIEKKQMKQQVKIQQNNLQKQKINDSSCIIVDQNQENDIQLKEKDDEYWDDQCFKCKKGGKLICCDSCPHAYHLKCVDLAKAPEGEWFCSQCSMKPDYMVKTRSTGRTEENNE